MIAVQAAFIALALSSPAVEVAQATGLTNALICGLEEQAGSWVVQPNEVEGSILVNSKLEFPANFSDASISWKMQPRGDEMLFLSINRYTGDFVMGNTEFPVLRRGKCTKATERQF